MVVLLQPESDTAHLRAYVSLRSVDAARFL